MDPSITAGVPATTGPVHFLNIEYLFYAIYQWTHGGSVSGGVAGSGGDLLNTASLISTLTVLWIALTILAYLLSAGFIALLIYSSIRMHQAQDADARRYGTVHDIAHAIEETEHHRWTHVRELIESPTANDWRQAIIEADIILDDMLTRIGYTGSSVGEKLKMANATHFRTLQDAWEAHKVRNEITHQGSTYPLTDKIAYRTILQYENVFKEHGEI